MADEDDEFNFNDSNDSLADPAENAEFLDEEVVELETDAQDTDVVPKSVTYGEDTTQVTFLAEVVLLCTSLGSHRHQFFDSIRAISFLNCKGIPYYLIDANRDVSVGANLADQQLISDWMSRGLLLQDDDSEKSKANRFVIPQILIDGISIGGFLEIQDLEEDGDLDWMLAQVRCPACLCDKAEAHTDSCEYCNASSSNLIEKNLVEDRKVQRMLQGQLCFDDAAMRARTDYKEMIDQAAHNPALMGHMEMMGADELFET